MIRNLLNISAINNSFVKLRHASAAAPKEKWDLFAGVLVERLPIITKSLKPLEQEYMTLLKQIEFENSLKSDHELQHEKDKRQAELLKKGAIEMDLDSEATKLTAQDLKDSWTEEFAKFEFESRITKADKENDMTSLNRKLEETLILLVEHKLGDSNLFLLPQGKRVDGETMRQTAERVLKEKCGDEMKVMFYGNAPCGFYKFKYPVAERKDAVGAKVFFFRTCLKAGALQDKKLKFEWLDQQEMSKKLKPAYFNSVSQFLV